MAAIVLSAWHTLAYVTLKDTLVLQRRTQTHRE